MFGLLRSCKLFRIRLPILLLSVKLAVETVLGGKTNDYRQSAFSAEAWSV